MKNLWIYPEKLDAYATLTPYENNIPIVGYRGVSPAAREGIYFSIPDNLTNGWGFRLQIYDGSKLVTDQAGMVNWGAHTPTNPPEIASFWADDFKILKPFIPNPPSREEVLSGSMHFRGGLVIQSPTNPAWSKMPWWPSALSWLDYDTRQAVYEQMREAGDTHAIIHVPTGDPLYGAPFPNFYRIDNGFGALDWSDHLNKLDHRFIDLVEEVISEGFKFIIFMNEYRYASDIIIELVMEAFKEDGRGLEKYGFILPGYDGVFYGEGNGWVGDAIKDWAAIARRVIPDCYLGIEHNFFHIPIGGATADYAPGGYMDGFDVVLGEFPTCDPRPIPSPPGTPTDQDSDAIWQVLGRMIKPYHAPPEQTTDLNPPFYLVDSPRGARYYWFFETWEPYHWVRCTTDAEIEEHRRIIENERSYAQELGARFIG
jgi:hypothetical protein